MHSQCGGALLIRPPLCRLDDDTLPPLGDYQVALVRRYGLGGAGDALAERVIEAFRDLRG